MKCPNCNRELSEGAKFCTGCGTKIETANTPVNSFSANENDFDDSQTEIIFDKKLPKERLNKGSGAHTIFLVIGFIIVLAAAGTAIFLTNQNANKKIQEASKTGMMTLDNGKIGYFIGGNLVKDEIKNDGGNLYYFDNDGYLVKGEEGKEGTWKQIKNDWYFIKGDGKIVTDNWVDNQMYHVDEYGKMQKNTRIGEYLLGPDGKWVDEAAIKAAEEAARLAAEKNRQVSQPVKTVQPTQPVRSVQPTKAAIDIDYTKEVWIEDYENFSDYISFDDETNVDVSIKLPVFGGQNPEEADAMNNCIQELKDNILNLADAKISEEDNPRKYSLTTVEIVNIETNKVNVVLKGKLERQGKPAKDVRIRFIYDRASQTAFVND